MTFEEFLAEATEQEIFQMMKEFIAEQPEWRREAINFHADPDESLNRAAQEFIQKSGYSPDQLIAALHNINSRRGGLRTAFAKFLSNRPAPQNTPRLKGPGLQQAIQQNVSQKPTSLRDPKSWVPPAPR